MLYFRYSSAIVSAAIAAVLCACSGGGSGTAGPTPGGGAFDGSMRFVVPARATTAGRARAFISPSAASVSIAVSRIASPVVANIGAGSSLCTTVTGGRSCAVPIQAPGGTDTITITLYDGPGATGHVLGSGSTSLAVSGDGFSTSVVVDGAPGSIHIGAGAASLVGGVAGSTTITVDAFDADGNPITGSYATPVTLTVSDPAAFSLSPSTVDASGEAVTLSYNGTPASAVTIGASSASVSTSAVEPVTVTVTSPNPPLVLAPPTLQFTALAQTQAVAVTGPTTTNFGSVQASSSNPAVATVAVASGGTSLTVTATGVGSATVTVSTLDGSASAATLTVAVGTTVINPSVRGKTP